MKRKKKFVRKSPKKPVRPAKNNKWSYYGILLLIIILSFVVYLPVLNNGFVWDDEPYIITNQLLQVINLKDIFSQPIAGNYHPLTILVLAIEYQFFGLNETGYHVVNLLLHLINVILVFYAVFLLVNKLNVALVTALLFGIHPLHVESVAWISELKDMLYTLFFLASYIYYLKYMKEKRNKNYIIALMLFSLSLLSKAMAVSLPVVLLLTDIFKGRKMSAKLLYEKLPFFLLSISFGIVAVYSQESEGAILDLYDYTILQRIGFVCYGFLTYIYKLFLPLHLSAFYPYPIDIGTSIPTHYYFYMFLVLGLFAYIIYSLRYSKKILFGVGFFIITVFLVLQLLPVGNAIMADRYSYIPSIGIFFLAGEAFNFLWNKKLKIISIILLCVISIFFSVKTYQRCGVWKNEMTLWSDVINQYQIVPMAYLNRGKFLRDTERYDEMLSDFNNAIELKPDYYEAYINRGNVFRLIKRYDEAILDFNKAIEFKSNSFEAYNNRGTVYMNERKYIEASSDFNKAIELKQDYGMAYANLGIVMFNSGKNDSACIEFQNAINSGFQPAINLYNKYCR